LIGAGGHGGSGKAADLQARYNEIASVVARHTTSSSPSTFRRLVHSSSIEQRGTTHSSSALAVLTTAQHTKPVRNRRRNTGSLNSNESSNSSMSEEDYDYDYNETDGSGHVQRPIEPILTAANVGPTAGTSLNQPFQIRSSVHLEHRLGPMTINHQSPNVNNHVASCAVCSIL
jgi:hypothetical protein